MVLGQSIFLKKQKCEYGKCNEAQCTGKEGRPGENVRQSELLRRTTIKLLKISFVAILRL